MWANGFRQAHFLALIDGPVTSRLGESSALGNSLQAGRIARCVGEARRVQRFPWFQALFPPEEGLPLEKAPR